MDTRLKERLIGATVLVLAAVLFIPMVLDGPGSQGQVSRNVPLPAPDETSERRTVKIDLTAPAQGEAPVVVEEPASVDLVPGQQAAAGDTAGVEPVAEPARPSPQKTQAQDAAADRSAESASVRKPEGEWTVQAGSFTRQDNAESLAAELRKLGFPAYVSRYDDGKRIHFRVRVGGFPSRDAAQAKADEVRGRTGEPATPVPAR